MAILTAFVWLFYLQILVSGLRRQRRTEILIHLGGSQNLNARVFVSNLGLEPIYILEIILTVHTKDGTHETSIADRTEVTVEELKSPSATTLQGPLNSGEFVDIGSVENILQRVKHNTYDGYDINNIEGIEIKIAAITAASTNIVAAYRKCDLRCDNNEYWIRPTTLYATQIRGWCGRYQLKINYFAI
ncbi:hypothetical protein [Ahrensia sp. 13_GOM-1096m]|uniref:hypothetical protein n=1 Tax=Ahrensia sp. 13_GOM-1096m TaxID=1380380 RepID=UPI00047ADC5B|nr:hypothetical protein [Ahrensia sp. 13_GOM-1096m]